MNTQLMFLTLLALAFSLPAGSSEPLSDSILAQRATALVEQLRDGDFETPQSGFDEAMRAALPADRLAQTWRGIETQAGKLLDIESSGASDKGAYRIHHVDCRFERMPLVADVVFSSDGAITGLFFRPAAAQP